MSNFKLKKGVNLSLEGAVSGTSTTQVSAKRYAVVPDDFTGIIPRLEVKEGDKVLAGDALYHDKNHPQIKISSPVSGTIEAIERGERRKILSIVILPDSENQFKVFNAKDAKELMLESGLWAAMRQRPYDIVPDPDVAPRDIFVTAFDSAPLAAPMSLQVAGKEEYLQKGIDALGKMTEGKVYVGCAPEAGLSLKGCEVNTFAGPHPAGNAGVQLANVKPVNKGETVWTLDAVTVARLGELIATKKLPVETIATADYRVISGVNCIYVETAADEDGYVLRYWVSVDTGLLTAAEKLLDGESVYRMAGLTVDQTLPPVSDFTLPDGRVLVQS